MPKMMNSRLTNQACFELGGAAAAATLAERFEREALPQMKSLYATACRLTRNAADAEDLVQETYLRAFRAFGSYEPDTNIRGWLYTILHRTRTDQLRKAGRSPQTVELPDEGPLVTASQDALAGGQEEIARALDCLPEVFRTAIVLRDVQDFTYAEMASILAVPIGTVMSRIHRGRALMRRALRHRRAA
jgi:RNA polymerase sigma-70 factor, ECF subfamily